MISHTCYNIWRVFTKQMTAVIQSGAASMRSPARPTPVHLSFPSSLSLLSQWASTWASFVSRKHLTMWKCFQLSQQGRVPLASSEWRPGMLLNILRCIGQSPITTNHLPQKVNIVSCLRNPELGWPIHLCLSRISQVLTLKGWHLRKLSSLR